MEEQVPACIRVVTRDVRQDGYVALWISVDPCPLIAWCEAHAQKRWSECALLAQGGYSAVPDETGEIRLN
jgi:hypothetical protein